MGIYMHITQGYCTLVDIKDYPIVKKYKWQYSNGYAIRTQWLPGGKRKTVRLHREILNCPNELQVDHEDGDGLCNLRLNLRVCNSVKNSYNREIDNRLEGKSSKFKGVSYHKRLEKWMAYIRVDYKLHHLGYYSTEILAASAYNQAAKENFGEFAKLNNLEEVVPWI